MKRATLATVASLLLSLLAPAASSAAGPQLFKCVDGGRTVYQQQACPVTSQPADTSASGTHAAAKAASEPVGRIAKVRPPSPPASTALATPR